MTLLTYIALALVAGSVLGTALGFMMNAQDRQVPELRRWLALAGTGVVVMGCAVVMKSLSDGAALSTLSQLGAGGVFLASLGTALSRWPLRA
jgi:L-cystine uptake protein TcyP (sodium:dicarboxylate symporter family)